MHKNTSKISNIFRLKKYLPILRCSSFSGKENSVIVDVGGLFGQMLQLFHKQLPNLKCINLDLPHVMEKMKPTENIKMVGADMFKVDPLPKCDVIFTKHILHNWPDEKCIEILKNSHAALEDDGIVFNVSFHLAEPGQSNDEWENFAMDMTMLVQFGEAKERTVTEYKDMHNKGGSEVVKAVKLGPVEIPPILIIASKN